MMPMEVVGRGIVPRDQKQVSRARDEQLLCTLRPSVPSDLVSILYLTWFHRQVELQYGFVRRLDNSDSHVVPYKGAVACKLAAAGRMRCLIKYWTWLLSSSIKMSLREYWDQSVSFIFFPRIGGECVVCWGTTNINWGFGSKGKNFSHEDNIKWKRGCKVLRSLKTLKDKRFLHLKGRRKERESKKWDTHTQHTSAELALKNIFVKNLLNIYKIYTSIYRISQLRYA